MKRRQYKEWFMSVFLVVIAIVSLELDDQINTSQTLHNMVLALAVVLILVSLANTLYQRANAKASATKSSKHMWWLDDNWSNWGGI